PMEMTLPRLLACTYLPGFVTMVFRGRSSVAERSRHTAMLMGHPPQIIARGREDAPQGCFEGMTAYSTPKRPPIPGESCHRFHGTAATCSTPKRPLMP